MSDETLANIIKREHKNLDFPDLFVKYMENVHGALTIGDKLDRELLTILSENGYDVNMKTYKGDNLLSYWRITYDDFIYLLENYELIINDGIVELLVGTYDKKIDQWLKDNIGNRKISVKMGIAEKRIMRITRDEEWSVRSELKHEVREMTLLEVSKGWDNDHLSTLLNL